MGLVYVKFCDAKLRTRFAHAKKEKQKIQNTKLTFLILFHLSEHFLSTFVLKKAQYWAFSVYFYKFIKDAVIDASLILCYSKLNHKIISDRLATLVCSKSLLYGSMLPK